MTKSITVAGKQTSVFGEKKYTAGLDLGDRWSWYCVLDEGGEAVFERQTEYHGEGPQRSIRGDAAQPGGAGDGNAFAVDQPVIEGAGT